MGQNNGQKKKEILTSLIGDATPAKASGLTYSLSSILSVVLAFLFMIIITVIGAAKEGYETTDWYLYFNYLLSPLAFALVAFLVFRWTKSPLKEELVSQKCAAKYFLIAILLQCGLFCLSQLNGLFLDWLSKFGYKDTPIRLPSMDGFGFVGILIVVALLPAVFEEIIFRGLLLKGMRAFGIAGAILINGALFALYHQNPAQTLYQFCCGAAFALVAIRSGSILPTVLSHFINNALILTLTKFGVESFPLPVLIVVLAVSVLCLISSMVWLIFFDRQPKADGEKKDRAEQKRFWLYASVGIAFCALTWLGVLFMGL
ncbi:MAG: CPBP family intramembrane metalloprotease [Clostridia bacterium]|nr:CPBP family intramembrane metalloprotease [Clostridia bacterium]